MTEIPTPPLVKHPAELSWETLDQLDWQLWMLAILLITVLGGGIVSFMFPAAFWLRDGLAFKAPEQAFFGFCALLTLVLVYLLQKQSRLRQLKRELIETQAALAVAERQAAIQSFETLPSITQFRDTLAMEYRRASSSHANLTVLLFSAPTATLEALGRLSRLLRSMLRPGETIYRISDMAVGVILPGMKRHHGASFAANVEAHSTFQAQELEVNITAFPEDTSSLTELEGNLRRQLALH